MDLFDQIIKKNVSISVSGLGYVGLPIAIAFSKKVKVIGFDTSKEKITNYKKGIDVTREVGNEALQKAPVVFTSNESRLKEAKFHIVAVPTPVNLDNTPDLSFLLSASEQLGRNLVEGSVVVFESTVYPGVTEDICIPILENESGLKCGSDFKVGYSPERINPGDKKNRLEKIIKVVSGIDKYTLDVIAKTYELVVEAGVYKATSIKVAEAAKVIENCQRDINIAFMNELSIIFNKMGINTKSVLAAAGTKWNFLDFTPGLVGGHCIGVDPYYLTYKAGQLGYHSQIILSGRRINDNMGKYIAGHIVKKLLISEKHYGSARIGILGFTFKENCPDTRNTKVIDIINELEEYGIKQVVCDPIANYAEVESFFRINLTPLCEVKDVDILVVAVPHKEFLEFSISDINKFFKNNCKQKIIFDLKSIYDRSELENNGFTYWSL